MIDLQSIFHGIVCFSFDDARYKDWLPQMPLFEKYGAHATFFFSGNMDTPAIEAMKELLAHGHSVGFHTVNHLNADKGFSDLGAAAYVAQELQPQIDACKAAGLSVPFFAYPNCRFTAETDSYLLQNCGFLRVRTGLPKWTKEMWFTERPDAFLSLEAIPVTRSLPCVVFGADYYKTKQENLDDAFRYCAEKNVLFAPVSHGMSNTPGPVDVSLDMLEACLKKCAALGVKMLSYGELPQA